MGPRENSIPKTNYIPMENLYLTLSLLHLTWAIIPGLTGKGWMGGAWVTIGTEYPVGWLRFPLRKKNGHHITCHLCTSKKLGEAMKSLNNILLKMCYRISVSTVQSTYLAWWEDKEEGQVGMSHCNQIDHSQLLELSQDATLRELTGL